MDHVTYGPTRLPSELSKAHGRSSQKHFKCHHFIDLLVHTQTHEEHIQVLEKVLERLHSNNLKINLEKCYFGNKEVSYLGFTLTPASIKPGKNKLKAIKDAKPPTDVKTI